MGQFCVKFYDIHDIYCFFAMTKLTLVLTTNTCFWYKKTFWADDFLFHASVWTAKCLKIFDEKLMYPRNGLGADPLNGMSFAA